MRAESVQRSPASRVVVSLYILLIGACSFLPLVLVATPANGQALVLMPGETYPNIAAAGKVVQSSQPVDPTPNGAAPNNNPAGTAVAFSREDADTQNIYVYASDAVHGFGNMVARGILFVDFCVPRPGADACDSVSDPNAPVITISLTFQYGVIGQAQTNGPFADARLGLTGSVVDTEIGGYVAFLDLLRNDLSSHGIQFAPISIDLIPLPLPNHTNATISQPVTFPSIQLKRGRIYRFQLSAAATADGDAWLDAFRGDCVIFNCERRRVMLRDLTVTVGQDLTDDLLGQLKNMQDVVSALQQQIGNLVTRIDALETKVQEITSTLNGAKPKPGKKNK